MKYAVFTIGVVLALLAGSDDAALSLTAGGCLIWLYKFSEHNIKR